MIDYEERLYDLIDFCQLQYGIDAIQVRAITTCLIPMDYPIWLICDAQSHMFWEHLGTVIQQSLGGFPLRNLAWLRVQFPRIANIQISKYLAQRKERPLIWYDRMGTVQFGINKRPHPRHMYHELVEECLRIRVPTATLRLPSEDAQYELSRLLRLVINPNFRTERPALIKPNDALMTYANIIYKANQELSNPSSFMRNICRIPHAHRLLHGRDKLTDDDWLMQYHIMSNCIRAWDYKILRSFSERPGYMDIPKLREATDIGAEKLTDTLVRLHENGLVLWPRKRATQGRRRRWICLEEVYRHDIESFIMGRARWW